MKESHNRFNKQINFWSKEIYNPTGIFIQLFKSLMKNVAERCPECQATNFVPFQANFHATSPRQKV